MCLEARLGRDVEGDRAQVGGAAAAPPGWRPRAASDGGGEAHAGRADAGVGRRRLNIPSALHVKANELSIYFFV